MRICGPAPRHNLLLDGYEECADFVARQITRDQAGHLVHVAPDGGLRVTRKDRQRVNELPDAWMVGAYAYPARLEWIEDDLLQRQRELAA